ncbi:HDIG domain-containing protein [Simkania negevensis]|uniref:HDIG domain-containing protein n=1 Tax=Simkania negevensis TaxID=83561 RepID=A0ABS3AR04_9BACT|nr:HDIG domain-containing protein [Simkania negevensis]
MAESDRDKKTQLRLSPRQEIDLRFPRESGFFDSNVFFRVCIGIVFTVCLFAFLHFREVRVDTLELNTTATKYVVAQVDFEFPDDEATLILRQEAGRDIGKVYRFDEREIRQRFLDFEAFLIHDNAWREEAPEATFEEIYKASDLFENAIIQGRFTDVRTLQKMHEVNIDDPHYFAFVPSIVGDGELLPKEFWGHITSAAFAHFDVRSKTKKFFIDYFDSKRWRFEDDITAQRTLHRLVQARIPDVVTHIEAGKRLVDQGERVTSRHVAMLQAMKQALSAERNLWHPVTLLGSLIITLVLVVVATIYLYRVLPDILVSNRKLTLVVSVIIVTLFLAKVAEYLLINNNSQLIEMVRYPLFVPFAAILLCGLTNARVAALVAGFLLIVLTMALSIKRTGFLTINTVGAVVAILSMHSLHKRKEIFFVCFKVWLVCIPVIVGFSFYHDILWNFAIVVDVLSVLGFMALTAILVVGLFPLFETIFHIITDITLMEFMDPSNELLRRLTIETPGTYQHSVVVGNLSESSAIAIGANGLFCRVSTLYHDIGKLTNPQYFSENQQGELSMHQLLTPKESAEVIMAHVSEGITLARKHRIPEQIVDIIKEHHGTTLVLYFYIKQIDLVGGDKGDVDEKEYRYTGPKPKTKESAIIMIADAVEASSRSLREVSEVAVAELISRIVREKAEDGQFDECNISFEELGIVKRVMLTTLLAAIHSRIRYPRPKMSEDERD